MSDSSLPSTDRNFDDLVDRFEHRIYNSLKGDIRLAVLWRDMRENISELESGEGRSLLDVGAGFGQFSIEMAKKGYEVTYNDLSKNMMEKAQHDAKVAEVFDTIKWTHCPYQALGEDGKKFDLIFCHAVLEWLEKPEELIAHLKTMLKPKGVLSFCFYNPVGMTYRNLVLGNFYRLKQDDHEVKGGLTPNNPVEREKVMAWLQASDFSVLAESGIRVFSDYVALKRGGNMVPKAVIEMELEYSNREPYRHMGRYVHIMAQLN